jgi:hypothetical protein
METFADLTLAVIFLLLLLANFAVMLKFKTYKSFSPGFVSVGLILFVSTRFIQLCYMCKKKHDQVNFMDDSRLGRALHDLTLYFFSIVSFALLLQWFWTFEILNDPVKAVNQKNSNYFSKVLCVVFLCSLVLMVTGIIFDWMS